MVSPLSSNVLPDRSRWVRAALLLLLMEVAKVPTNSLAGDKTFFLGVGGWGGGGKGTLNTCS